MHQDQIEQNCEVSLSLERGYARSQGSERLSGLFTLPSAFLPRGISNGDFLGGTGRFVLLFRVMRRL